MVSSSETKTPFAASALRDARILADMSLAEVGRQMGVSRQYIQLLEAGERWPNVEFIERLASVLSVEPAFFASPHDEHIDDSAVFFRCAKKTTKREKERARAGVRRYRQLVVRLQREIRFPAVTVPKVAVASFEDIENAALACREALGVGRDQPIRSMVRAVERAGVFVTDLYCAAPGINAFSVRTQRPLVVRSTAKGSTSRSRFDLAHELGHLVMHPRRGDESVQERQADHFGGAFLLPRGPFIAEFPRNRTRVWTSLFRMKARWGASVSSIVFRARQLNLIDELTYQSRFRYIGRQGWRSSPEPEEPAREMPELVPLAFREIFRARQVRPLDVLRELGWSESLFERVVGDGVAQEVMRIGTGAILQLKPRPVGEDGRA